MATPGARLPWLLGAVGVSAGGGAPGRRRCQSTSTLTIPGMEDPSEEKPAVSRAPSARERLIDAGLSLFGTAGFEATTIAMLCREARVSTRVFYRHFGDRISLFRAVFDRQHRRILEPVREATAAAPPVWEVRARIWAQLWLGTLLEDRRCYRVLYREGIGVDAEFDAHRRRILQRNCRSAAQQMELCARARGEVRPSKHYEIPGASYIGAAREVMDQFVDGTLADHDAEAVLEAIVSVAVDLGGPR